MALSRAVMLLTALCLSSSANAQDSVKAATPSVVSIMPIFSQLVRLTTPATFKAAHENQNRDAFLQEWVPAGESVEAWTQLISVTGLRAEAAVQGNKPEEFLGRLAGGYQRSCPTTFAVRAFGAMKISGYDAFAAVVGCGSTETNGKTHAESALVVVIKAARDYYTVQWAERAVASDKAPAFDEALWVGRFRQVSPIVICDRVPGEAAPYPSCVNR